LTLGAWDIVAFTDVPPIDTQKAWDPVTKKITPQVPGVYDIIVRTYGVVTTGGVWGHAVLKNDSGTFSSQQTENVVSLAVTGIGTTGGSTGSWQSTTGRTKMNGTTDFFRLFWYNSNIGTFYGAGANPIMAVWLLP
jgi:hypothetical protein